MIEELKPCPEMIKKVARAMCRVHDEQRDDGNQYALDSYNAGASVEYWDTLARAAITAYDPDKRLKGGVGTDRRRCFVERLFTCRRC